MIKKHFKKKTIIIGAGLGGLIHGILLKKARPNDEVIIYDLNKVPGGFCNAFQRVTTYNNEKIKYTINIPVVSSDFEKNEPFDLFLKYLGVKNLKWKLVKKPFQYYPVKEDPFLFTKDGVKDLIMRTPEKEKKQAKKFFKNMQRLYRDVFYKAKNNPTFFEAIKMLITIPKTVFELLAKKTYLKHIKDSGVHTPLIQELFSVTEGFMGVEVERASAVGELLMIQSFLENNLMQPADGDSFQTLSDRLADRFIELGGQLNLRTKVNSLVFDKRKAVGVLIGENKISADNVILAVAQDKIESLIKAGEHIRKIKKLLKKVRKISYPNSDFYSFYLVDKDVVKKHPKLGDVLYHIYRKKGGLGGDNWNLFTFIPDELYNNKYYVMAVLYIEHDQDVINEWLDLRTSNYKKYAEKKEKMNERILKELQAVEPIFKENPPAKHLLSMTPASFIEYGSKYPISGLAQGPDNFGTTRMKQVLLDNLFISGGASFSAGVWGAVAGAWQGFVASYKKIYGIEIGDKNILYKPGLKNLP